jgi:hypothetical protein
MTLKKNSRNFLVLAVLLSCVSLEASAETKTVSAPIKEKAAASTSFLEVNLVNLIPYSFSRYVSHSKYGEVSLGSIEGNFEEGWWWDQDPFLVNQIEHPYQGSLYFGAGRSLGYGYYGSTLFTMGGSLLWEYCGETQRPSINDLVDTTFGGSMLGEMSYRLHVAASRSNPILALILSPVAWVNERLFGRKPEGNFHGLDAGESSISVGPLYSDKDLDSHRGPDAQKKELGGELDLHLVYGKTYGLRSAIPFENFDQRIEAAFTPSYYLFSFFSEGFLYSWSPSDDAQNRMSFGPAMNYDFLFGSDLNFVANTLGLSLKHEHNSPGGWRTRSQLHLGAVVLGATDYIYLRYGDVPALGSDEEDRRNYDFGLGEAGKLALSVSKPGLGELEFRLSLYNLVTIPDAVPLYGSNGDSVIGLASLSYSLPIREGLSVELADDAYLKRGFYESAQDIRDWFSKISLRSKWAF